MHKSRTIGRVLGALLVAMLFIALLAVLALASSGGQRSHRMSRAMSAAVQLDHAIEACAATRRDAAYQGGTDTDCLDLGVLATRERALERSARHGLRAHVTPVAAGRGYVAQLGSDATGWFIVARDASGEATTLCSRTTLESLEPDPDADFPGCRDGRWNGSREA